MMLIFISAAFTLMTNLKDLSNCVDRHSIERPEQGVVESVRDWFDALLACRPNCGDLPHLFCRAKGATPAVDSSVAELTDEERELEMCMAEIGEETTPPSAPSDGPSDSKDDQDCGCQG